MDHNKDKIKPIKFLFLIISLTLTFLFGLRKPIYSYCESGCTIDRCNHPRCNTCAFCPEAGSLSLGKLKGLGPLGTVIERITSRQEVSEPISLLNKVVSMAIGMVTLVAFLYFLFQFFIAGLNWVTAGGDQKKIESAGNKITKGIIGMVIVVSAIFIIDLLGKVLGIDILNPFGFIVDIW